MHLEHRRPRLEKVIDIVGPAALEIGRGRHVFFEREVKGIDGIELSASFGVCEHLVCFLDAFKKRIVVGRVRLTSFFVGVVFEHLFAIYDGWVHRFSA